jgi:argininosuccinate lyase
VSERLRSWENGLIELIMALRRQAEAHLATIMPGYTHLQPAQPVSLAHHLLAYCQMFRRDVERIADSQRRTRVSPLGAAALGGTTYPLDPRLVAEELGFGEVFRNSLDAVSDRDFVLEAVFVSGLIMTHLSRLCEELVLWANPGFHFVLLPDRFATGSSIMPQKKNPDVAELMRGKTGRTYGALMSLFTLLKGLPLAYNRDLQEDKPPFVEADKTVDPSLRIMARMVEAMRFDPDRMRQATSSGYLNATEFADYLVGKGIPFRQAHHITGQAVAYAESQGGKGLEDLGLEELRSFSPLVEEDVYEVLDYARAVAKRMTPGGTGYDSVRGQIDELAAWLGRKDGREDGGSGGSV